MMIIKVRVKTNTKEEIEKISDSEYKVSLKEKPKNNKANIALLKIMKKYFKKDVKIIKGLKSKDKILEVIE